MHAVIMDAALNIDAPGDRPSAMTETMSYRSAFHDPKGVPGFHWTNASQDQASEDRSLGPLPCWHHGYRLSARLPAPPQMGRRVIDGIACPRRSKLKVEQSFSANGRPGPRKPNSGMHKCAHVAPEDLLRIAHGRRPLETKWTSDSTTGSQCPGEAANCVTRVRQPRDEDREGRG